MQMVIVGGDVRGRASRQLVAERWIPPNIQTQSECEGGFSAVEQWFRVKVTAIMMRQASQIAIEPHSWIRSTEDFSDL
jgi:hypothetical protein